jgi:ribosome-binding protein aMBF1 (putative translation factor)
MKRTIHNTPVETIDVNDSDAFATLRQKLGISRKDLLNAIQKAGNNIKKIERYLRTKSANQSSLLGDI